MKIVLGSGVDNILLGRTEHQIIQQLGEPDKIWLTDFGDRELMYFERQLILKIESENNNRLGWIEVRNRSATLWGYRLWEIPKEELLARFVSKLGEKYEFEDYGSLECYSFNKNWVELQYELNQLACCNFGVLYGEADQALWPSVNT